MINPGLEGKVVLITGANNPFGVGAAVGRAFSAQGARVFLHYFRQHVAASPEAQAARPRGDAFYRAQQAKSTDELVAGLRDDGVQVATKEADLSNAAIVPGLFDEAERTLGPVDVLVNNAAHWEAETFLAGGTEIENRLVELWTDRPQSLTAGAFDRIFAVNTRAAALMMAEFAQRHINRGGQWGRIVNVSSDGAECFPSEVTYGAGKLALESYSRSAASELGRFGVTVNVVSLGPIQTGWITEELEREILPTIPLRRIGTPEDIADVIVSLASEQAGWLTGQRFYAGGGHKM